MPRLTHRDEFRFSREQFFGLNEGKRRLTPTILEQNGFTLVELKGYLLVTIFTDSPNSAYEEAKSELLAMMQRMEGEVRRKLSVYGVLTATLVKQDEQENKSTFRVNVKLIHSKEESIEETESWLHKVQNSWRGIVASFEQQLIRIEQYWETPIEHGAFYEFLYEYGMIVFDFEKLAPFRLDLSPEEELLILQRRKEKIAVTKEEEEFILSERRKKREQAIEELTKEVPEPSPRETPPKKKGILQRFVDFVKRLWRL